MEYLTIEVEYGDIKAVLDKSGAEGWELVGVIQQPVPMGALGFVPQAPLYLLIFKRTLIARAAYELTPRDSPPPPAPDKDLHRRGL